MARDEIDALRTWSEILHLRFRVQALSERVLIAGLLTNKAPHRLRRWQSHKRLSRLMGVGVTDVAMLAGVNKQAAAGLERMVQQMIHVAGSFFLLIDDLKHPRHNDDELVLKNSKFLDLFHKKDPTRSFQSCSLVRMTVHQHFQDNRLFGPRCA